MFFGFVGFVIFVVFLLFGSSRLRVIEFPSLGIFRGLHVLCVLRQVLESFLL